MLYWCFRGEDGDEKRAMVNRENSGAIQERINQRADKDRAAGSKMACRLLPDLRIS